MFNEKKEEWSSKQGKNIPVWQSDKYTESKEKAIEIIESKKYGLKEGDFWILMNETKSGKMAYTGLIISHNGCLKINDALPKEQKFHPCCVSIDKEGYNGSLVYSYCCEEQGIYEVGEVNPKNCKIEYPYAMAFKRMMDRVVLKTSKLAYSGIYSEVEADEFSQSIDAPDGEEPKKAPATKKAAQKKEETPKAPKEEKEEVYKCCDCGNALVWTRTTDGREMSPINIRDVSYKRFARVLCPECMKKEDAKRKEAIKAKLEEQSA